MQFLLSLTLLAGLATAQEESCPGTFALSEFREAMDAVNGAIADGNGTLARRILDDVHDAMRCTNEVVTPADLGRYARQMSVVAFYGQDHEDAEAWAQLAAETLGDVPVPASLNVSAAYEDMTANLPLAIQNADATGLNAPKKGAVLIDGRFASQSLVSLSVPHLVQVVDKRGEAQQTHWQDGAAFSPELLTDSGQDTAPRWYTEPPPPAPFDAVADVDTPIEAPPEPLPLADDASTEEPPDTEPATAPEPPEKPPEPEASLAFDEQKAVAECAWLGDVRRAWATGNTVYVNRKSWSVKTLEDQKALGAVLRSCGEFRANRRMKRWRAAKQHFSPKARKYRNTMVDALLTEEPVRKPRKKPAGQ